MPPVKKRQAISKADNQPRLNRRKKPHTFSSSKRPKATIKYKSCAARETTISKVISRQGRKKQTGKPHTYHLRSTARKSRLQKPDSQRATVPDGENIMTKSEHGSANNDLGFFLPQGQAVPSTNPLTVKLQDTTSVDGSNLVGDGAAMSTPRVSKTTEVGPVQTYEMRDPRDIPAAPRNEENGYLFSYRLFRGPEEEGTRMHYCTKLGEAETVCQHFTGCKLLGLDIEFPSSGGSRITDHISLMQIASESDIALLHIALFDGDQPKDFMPPTLARILQSKDVCKTGSMVKGDATKIEKHLKIKVQGLIDLKEFLYCIHPDERALKKSATLAIMVKRYFNVTLDKGNSKRCSNWSKTLDHIQKEYAATDAYASLKVFQAIDTERYNKRLPPPAELIAANSKPRTCRKPKTKPPDTVLFEALRSLRDTLVDRHGFTNQLIMTNAIMKKIVEVKPLNTTELRNIEIYHRSSILLYCDEIVEVVQKHVKNHRIVRRPRLKQSHLKGWASEQTSSSQSTSGSSQNTSGSSQSSYYGSQPSSHGGLILCSPPLEKVPPDQVDDELELHSM